MKKRTVFTVFVFLLVAISLNIFCMPIESDAAVLKIGDTLTIGKWEQNNNTADGAEALTWRVIDMKEGKAVLLSQNVIDCQKFGSNASWKASSVRAWLNETFYPTAFEDSEKAFILKKINQTQTADLSATETTEDYAFVLSVDEARMISKNIDGILKSKATESALKKGIFYGDDGSGYWWLRTPGNDSSHTAYVTTDGKIYLAGCKTDYASVGGIRPAVYIDLNKSGYGGNTLTINYVYNNGKVAAESYFAGISSGEKYDIKSPDISGYVADKANVSGTMETSDVVVTVTYKSNVKLERKITNPTKASGTNGTVVLNKIVPVGDGKVTYGYSLKKDINSVTNWSESTEFKGLVGGIDYYFFAKVTGSADYKDAYSNGTLIHIEKNDRIIKAPEILNYNHNAVAALDVYPDGGGVVMYGISVSDDSQSVKTWQQYPVFNGLSSGVKYYLFAKVDETDSYKAAYASTEFTTTSEKNATEIPTIKNVSENIIELNPVEILIGTPKYGISDTNDVSGVKEWSDNSYFGGLETGKRYYVFVKIDENTSYPTDVYSCVSAVTVSGVRSVIPPEVTTIGADYIQVNKISVMGGDFVYFGISVENNADNVSAWQIENEFKNLAPATDYYIFTKLSNGDSSKDIISNGVHVKTKELGATDIPSTNTPDASAPGTDNPVTDSGTNTPNVNTPGMSAPETDNPVTGSPENSVPATDSSADSTPGSEPIVSDGDNGNSGKKEKSSAWVIVVIVIVVLVAALAVAVVILKKKGMLDGIIMYFKNKIGSDDDKE